MSNPKTVPSSAPEPQAHNGWVRKCDLDAYLGRYLPLPTQVVSNEEYSPLPQTAEQRTVEHHLVELAGRAARKLGLSRRQFLRTSGGMAAAFVALNTVFGRFFEVDAAELFEPAAAEKKIDYFILDAQTHHVATPAQWPTASPEFLDYLVGLRRFARRLNPELKSDPARQDLYLHNYIKEVFLDSDTAVAVVSGLPSPTEAASVLPPELMAKTRSWVNELTRSHRVLCHGVFSPDRGTENLEWMQVQAEKIKINAWKGYTGQAMVPGQDGWSLDDEKLSYPALEYSRKLKIKNICLHKGLPLPGSRDERYNPKDIVRAARDFPDLNFLVYHSGFKSLPESLPAAQDGFQKSSYIPWVSDLCAWRKQNPQMRNVYMELGSTFGLMVVSSPLLCAHVLGMILEAFGPDHVLWGTDSIWWGSPRWQIEAFRRLEMPGELIKRFGYQPLTAEVKQKVFGLNAARIYGVDPKARRQPVPEDYIDRLKKVYQESSAPAPSNTQYGWVRFEKSNHR